MLPRLAGYRHFLVITIYFVFFGYWGLLCFSQGYLNVVFPTLPEAGRKAARRTYGMHWNPVSNGKIKTYKLEVAHDKSFSRLMFKADGITRDSMDVPMTTWPSGSYYWRVAAVIDGKEMPWSWRRKFVLD